ncbi:MAG: NAD(P)/FAD-dependent oxidoreductase [Deltaproteobacteria bacterium]|nr:NAD(P)/FAD-dependent oxidoreductase [Deltaproteobacteria bacterium]MCL5276351.1 NAD(P)/FAD-dependent oxidoreductase [Deltaproteobacteria bacterium]
MKYDVIVVGGGPGGSVAGMTAASRGLRTLVLERAARPGDKNVSGTGLSPKCFRDFEFMRRMELPHMRKADMASVHLVDKNNKEKVAVTFSPSDDAGYAEAREFLTVNVYRSELDPWLSGLAVQAGADLLCGAKVTDLTRSRNGKITGVVTDDGRRFSGDIIIGADGVISTVARASGIREKWAPSEVAQIINIDYGSDAGTIDASIGSNALHYWYAATFPVGYSFFSAEGFHVGLGCYLDWWKKNPQYYLRRMLEVDGVQRQIKLAGGRPREFQNHLVTFLTRPKKTYTDSVMLIGDAAGFACPYEAEGVYYAMMSGRIAATVASDAISRGDLSEGSLSEYEKTWWASPIGEEFIGGDSIEGFVRRIGFNPDAAAWITPLFNEVLFGLCNVADSHTNNARKLPGRILKYLPELADALKDDMGPLAIAIDNPPKKGPSKAVSYVLRKTMPFLLRLLAKVSASSTNRYNSVTTPLVMEHFLKPYVQEKLKKEAQKR